MLSGAHESHVVCLALSFYDIAGLLRLFPAARRTSETHAFGIVAVMPAFWISAVHKAVSVLLFGESLPPRLRIL